MCMEFYAAVFVLSLSFTFLRYWDQQKTGMKEKMKTADTQAEDISYFY